MSDAVDTSKFHVGLGSHFLSGAMIGASRFWRMVARLESMVLNEQLEDIRITKPVYVTGLARSGTTIMLEVLASHASVVTHRYSDFPGLFTPYWWGQASQNSTPTLEERAHGDGLMVSQNSPEAMEEVLWMAHFKNLHNTNECCILTADCENEAFEREYREHIRKLLLLRSGSRYVAKGNYNISRMGYIRKIFADSRFVIPIRHPVAHVASLIKQHKLFCQGQQDHPRAIDHLRRVGHFEFGLDRRPINLGNQDLIDEIVSDWKDGNSVAGWARYWAMLYGWLAQELKNNTALNKQCMIVKFEDLCSDPKSELKSVLEFCDLENGSLIEQWSSKITSPTYYRPDFSDGELELIWEHCGSVAHEFGYSDAIDMPPTVDRP